MIINLIKNRIEECYNSNITFKKFLNFRYGNNYIDIVEKELNDYILQKHDIYKSNNFKELIYGAFLKLKDGRLTNFLRNILTGDPKADRTYSHMVNDIKDKVDAKYKLTESYYSMSKYELDRECDKLLLEGKFLLLENTRKFIKDTFKINRYESFVFENRDLAKSILKRNNLDESDRVYTRIKSLLSDKPGLLGLFTYFNKVEKISFGRLRTLFQKMESNKDIINQLPRMETYIPKKGIFRGPYTMEDGRRYNSNFERLEDDITNLKDKHTAKIFADAYPGEIKKGLAENSDFIEIIKELTNNSDQSNDKLELYKKFWLNKVSRYKSQQELIDSLLNFVFADSSVGEIRNQINNNSDLKMVFDDGEIIVCRVLSYDAIQSIGNDTSWCIKDSLSYWTSYVNDEAVQLVIIDCLVPRSSVDRKIGVTFYSGGGFNTGHNVNDNYKSADEIDHILSKCDITLNELYNVAKDLGSNEYYDSEEVSEDNYRGR